MTHLESIAPVTKTLDLECPIEHAFDVFTRRLGTWWPLVTHSCFANPGAHIEFESWPGGQVWEITPTGERATWGTITDWRPPHSLSMTWHPGNGEAIATRLVVQFEETAGGRTRLTLTHADWQRRGTDAARTRDGYDTGWDNVLASYAARAVTRKTG